MDTSAQPVRRRIGRRPLLALLVLVALLVLLALTAAAEVVRSSAVRWAAACSSGYEFIFLAFLCLCLIAVVPVRTRPATGSAGR